MPSSNSLVPPSLQYLTIYNPTLKPVDRVPNASLQVAEGDGAGEQEDDEDREERAHIVFYTARERMESRDKMLRRVGLAKALVNFSAMFGPDEICSNVHSLSRRMVMVSPEPNYYIHACVEVAKVLRTPSDKKGKGRDKDKGRNSHKQQQHKQDKGKVKEADQPAYDYFDGSVHDVALKADLLRAYGQFKLTHGSFTTIMKKLGREALELQLERFFTVWAWSWDFEDGSDFESQFGVELDPHFPAIVPLLDTFVDGIGGAPSALAILPPYAVPSTQYLRGDYPPVLVQHLMKAIPPHRRKDVKNDLSMLDNASDEKPSQSSDNIPSSADTMDSAEPTGVIAASPSSTFLGSMDVRKWSWGGVLTFGKTHKKTLSSVSAPGSTTQLANKFDPQPRSSAEIPISAQTVSTEVPVDKQLLEDAILSNQIISQAEVEEGKEEIGLRTSPSTMTIVPLRLPGEKRDKVIQDVMASTTRDDASSSHSKETRTSIPAFISAVEPPEKEEHQITIEPKAPALSTLTIHLSSDDQFSTMRKVVYYATHDDPPMLIAFLNMKEDFQDSAEMESINFSVQALIKDVRRVIEDDVNRAGTETDVIPSTTNNLQPLDRYIISASGFMSASPGFSSKSPLLFDTQLIQATEPDIIEVFSRGQNPQHWHIAKKGVSLGSQNGGVWKEGEIYLEVFRKETSLTDVDNILAKVVKKSGLLDEIDISDPRNL